MILLIDNYDSFTYNLVQRIGEMLPPSPLEASPDAPREGSPDARSKAAAAIDARRSTYELRVVRNDKITAAEALALKPDYVIISPGPCSPNEAGVSNDIIRAFAGRTPLLGVCLGHQCIGHTYGMKVTRNYRLMHGKTSPIHHDGKSIFRGMSNPFVATRYHSLVILRDGFDHQRFEISAWTDENEIMAVRAKPGALLGGNLAGAPLEGVQFHPESFLTLEGQTLLANFLGLKAPTVVARTT